MNLHQLPLRFSGAPLEEARGVVLLVHGRGATAESILSLADAFGVPDICYLAPQASGNTWYPHSFLAPLVRNEPDLTAALEAVTRACATATQAGFAAGQIVVAGFSQGACLALEFAARRARRLGGIVAFSGGLIGSGDVAGQLTPYDKQFEYSGSLDGTPVFLGCSDRDPHIPVERVHQTTEVFRLLGANVTERIYPGMPHTVNEEEIAFARSIIQAASGSV